jgi:hypothetical protein
MAGESLSKSSAVLVGKRHFISLQSNVNQHNGGCMKNVEMKVEGTILTIKVDLSKEFGVSASGKSMIIASTEGNQTVEGTEEVKIGLNVYKRSAKNVKD